MMARFAEQIAYKSLAQLRPDPKNPRIAPRLLPADPSDADLYRYVARHHDALTIAESIAEFGYFPSEPLIVIKEPGAAGLLVVEGNRRLTALHGLADAELRETFTSNRQRWTDAAKEARLRKSLKVPVIRAESRDAARPLIGYRHVAGIQKWDAYPKARFVAQMIDEGLSFADAGDRAALSESATRSLYRNYAILRQADEGFRFNVNNVEERFGVFTAALNRVAIRSYIGATGPAQVVPIEGEGSDKKTWPLPSSAKPKLRKLFEWLFGSAKSDPLIEESRDLKRLAAVLAEEDGEKALEDTGSLDLAEAAIGLQTARLAERIQRARLALQSALGEAKGADDPEQLLELLDDCSKLITKLRRALK
jgi:hypothetical protein